MYLFFTPERSMLRKYCPDSSKLSDVAVGRCAFVKLVQTVLCFKEKPLLENLIYWRTSPQAKCHPPTHTPTYQPT